jgi:hypothetical protein
MGPRVVVTVLGAAAMIAGSFLGWTEIPLGGGYTYLGTDLGLSVFFNWEETNLADSFLVSAGMLIILLGIIAGVGAFLQTRWVSRIAGLVVTVALGLTVVRFIGESGPSIGLLLALAGGILALVGSFLRRGT